MAAHSIPESVVRELWNCFRSEEQAIAIYEAEVFWLQNREPYRTILEEEKTHGSWIKKWIPPVSHRIFGRASLWMISGINIFAGWLLGSFLSLLPEALRSKVHYWAELEAEKIYKNAEQFISHTKQEWPTKLRICQDLQYAADQEHRHAQIFNRKKDG